MADTIDVKRHREPSEQIIGRFVGILVFLAGISLLVLTFILTFQAFHNPDILLPMKDVQRTPPLPAIYVYTRPAVLLVLLFVMGYVASLIAARGAQLFFTARREVHHDAPGN